MSIDMSGASPKMDYDEHFRTYAGFLKSAQYGTVAVILVLLLLLMFVY